MKKYRYIFSILLIFLLPAPRPGRADEPTLPGPSARVDYIEADRFQVTVRFPRQSFDPRSDTEAEYRDRIRVSGCDGEALPGHPLLPRYYCRVIIPAPFAFQSLQIDETRNTTLSGSWHIQPAPYPVRFSADQKPPEAVPDPDIYTRESRWPDRAVEYRTIQSQRGVRYLTFRVTPAAYYPALNRLEAVEEIRFTVALTPCPLTTEEWGPVYDAFAAVIREKIVNPDDLDLYYSTTSPGISGIEYLIITDRSLAKPFEAFAAWKRSRGTTAEVVYTDDIYRDYTAGSDQYEIKACIRDYALNRGTVWVLLGGNSYLVPDFDCYAFVDRGFWYSDDEDDTIPTDLFYACLDDVGWNDDDDEYPCEMEDVSDYVSDVFLGRAPVGAVDGAQNFIDKVMAYQEEEHPAGWAEKLLLVSSELYETEDGVSDGEEMTEEIFEDSIEPYWTGDKFRFYDTATSFAGGKNYQLSPAHLSDQLHAGYNLIYDLNHGGDTTWYLESGNFQTGEVEYADNSGYEGVIYTDACNSNAFDRASPCLGAKFVREESGAAAYIGSSRYNYESDYVRAFFRCLCGNKPAGYPRRLGAVFAEHKSHFEGSLEDGSSTLWIQYALNLMGDPQMEIEMEDPDAPETAWGFTVNAGESEGHAVTADSGGNMILGGSFTALADFDPRGGSGETLRPADSTTSDGFVCKYNGAGKLSWARCLRSSENAEVLDVAVGPDDSVYATGYFEGTAYLVESDWESERPAITAEDDESDIFIVKFSSEGELQWLKSFRGSGEDRAQTLAVDRYGAVMIAGYFEGELDCSPIPSSSVETIIRTAPAEYSSSSGLTESVAVNPGIFGGEESGESGTSTAVARYPFESGYEIDPEIDGATAEELGAEVNDYIRIDRFDPGYIEIRDGAPDLTSAGGFDAVMIYLSDYGGYYWVQRLGGADNDKAFCAAVDPGTDDSDGDDGGMGIVDCFNFYVGGVFRESSSITAGWGDDEYVIDLESAGGMDGFFIKLFYSDGEIKSHGSIGGTGADVVYGITRGGGATYLTGYFTGTADLDPGAGSYEIETDSGTRNAFVIKAEGMGMVWAADPQQYSSSWIEDGMSVGRDIRINQAGTAVYAVGKFQGDVDFNHSDSVSAQYTVSEDIFLWALGTCGGYWDVYTPSSGDGDRANGVGIGNDGRIYCTGYFGDGDGSSSDDDFGSIDLTGTAGDRSVFAWKLWE